MDASFFDPGLLTARLVLERREELPDGQGGTALQWQALGDIWARIEPLAAELTEAGATVLQSVTHRILVRRRDDILPGLRLRKGARIFAILTAYDPDETGRFTVISASEEVPA